MNIVLLEIIIIVELKPRYDRWLELFNAEEFDQLHKELHAPDVILYPPGHKRVIGDGKMLNYYQPH